MFLKQIIFVIGCLSVFLGVIGLFLPLLPTTPFVLLSAWCFYRSSPRTHAWLCRQPVFGEALRDWEKNRSISHRNKIWALATIALSLIFIWVIIEVLILKVGVTLFLMGVAIFIVTRRKTPKP